MKTNHIPGRIVAVERGDGYIVVSINNIGDGVVNIRITDANENALWAAGEYWEALKSHGEQLRNDIEDDLKHMGLWEESE